MFGMDWMVQNEQRHAKLQTIEVFEISSMVANNFSTKDENYFFLVKISKIAMPKPMYNPN